MPMAEDTSSKLETLTEVPTEELKQYLAPAWPQWRFCSILKSKLQIIDQPVSQSASGSDPNRRVICKSLLVFNLKACDEHRRLEYVDPGHHSGVVQVDMHSYSQYGSLGDDEL